ncbi:MAG: J domain-containing protein [Terracidiphilus sp.]|jgi:hypothetical protein
MPCVCQQCLQHSKTLGLDQTASSGAVIRKAFRSAAKLWHPDRFENNPRAQKDAEEHFKLIQIAYRELWEHHNSPHESPHTSRRENSPAPQWEWPTRPAPEPPLEDPFAGTRPAAPPPTISFGDAPRCFAGPDFPPYARQIIADHLGDPENAIAIVDLSLSESPADSFFQFILFTVHGILVRNAHKIVSLLWYSDLGNVQIVDRRGYGKLKFWHRLAERLYGVRPKYSLLIYRRNGTLFCKFDVQMDDNVKKVIYNFLLRRKSENHL